MKRKYTYTYIYGATRLTLIVLLILIWDIDQLHFLNVSSLTVAGKFRAVMRPGRGSGWEKTGVSAECILEADGWCQVPRRDRTPCPEGDGSSKLILVGLLREGRGGGVGVDAVVLHSDHLGGREVRGGMGGVWREERKRHMLIVLLVLLPSISWSHFHVNAAFHSISSPTLSNYFYFIFRYNFFTAAAIKAQIQFAIKRLTLHTNSSGGHRLMNISGGTLGRRRTTKPSSRAAPLHNHWMLYIYE